VDDATLAALRAKLGVAEDLQEQIHNDAGALNHLAKHGVRMVRLGPPVGVDGPGSLDGTWDVYFPEGSPELAALLRHLLHQRLEANLKRLKDL
jgi:hypothetical protein